MRRARWIGAFLAAAASVLCLCAGPAFAQEAEEEDMEVREDEMQEEIYTFPKIEPHLEVEAGLTLVELEGAERAREYYYLHDSPYFGALLTAFPFPHRVYLELDIVNKNDYFNDLSYAYRDIVLSRWTGRAFFHNLENLALVDQDPFYTDVDVRDEGETYGVETRMNDFFLRFKTPDFPLHVYMDGLVIDKEGTMQQRFLGGSGGWLYPVRVSESRDIDWETSDIAVGVNSHLALVEADLSHSEKRFDSSADDVLTESYSADFERAAGVFPHNFVPDQEGSTNTLKLHTMTTGSLVASMTLSETDRENNESGTTADYFLGSGDVMWRPLSVVTLSAKYRHREKDVVNPDSLPANYLGYEAYTTPTADIKDSISTSSDSVSGRVKYRALKWVYLAVDYSYKAEEREDADEWSMPEKTAENTVTFSASAKLPRKMKIRGELEHKDIGSPAYNSDPEVSDSGKLSIAWTPAPRVTTFMGYDLAVEERDSLFESTLFTVDAKNRHARKQKLSGNASVTVLKDLSVTAGYAYMNNHVEQDLVYTDADDPTATADILDPSVRYKDTANNYMLSAAYAPTDKLFLNAGVSLTRSKAAFDPDEGLVESFSDIDLREVVYSVSAEYEIKGGWGVGAGYEYGDFDNLHEDPENLFAEDGTAHVISVTARKKW